MNSRMNSPSAPGKIGVVTVLYNSEPWLPEFFASIAAQSYTNFTVFAIDNASPDHSLALCRQHGEAWTILANAENRGMPAASNQGIVAALAAGCEYVLLLNNDVRFGPELFAQLVDGLRTQHCDMTTPLMYFYDEPETIWCAGGGFQYWAGLRQKHYSEGTRDTGQFTQPTRVDFSSGCCLLIRCEVFARIGMLDEKYFIYWDDTDLMLCARRAGLKLYLLPAAKLWHKVSASTGRQSDFTLRYSTRNHAYYLRKHLPSALVAMWTAIYCAFYAIGILLPWRSRRSRIQLRAWLEGLRMPLDSMPLA